MLEAIAIAIRLEAIASKLEAIPIKDWRNHVGGHCHCWRPSLLKVGELMSDFADLTSFQSMKLGFVDHLTRLTM